MSLPEQIMKCLKDASEAEYEYINPNFLVAISEALQTYCDLYDDDVQDWIVDMYGF